MKKENETDLKEAKIEEKTAGTELSEGVLEDVAGGWGSVTHRALDGHKRGIPSHDPDLGMGIDPKPDGTE